MEVVTQRRRRHLAKKARSPGARVDWIGIGLFAFLAVAAPLAFGGGDRVVQICLLTVFGVAMAVRPPQVVQFQGWTAISALALVALLLAKEFAPATLFGAAHWRTVLGQGYGLALPWSHHPEPGRAVDALLAAAAGLLWFLWVQTLAMHRENRAGIAWALAVASAIVAAVSFATHGMDPKAIYGLRFTPGWTGFGPFPNRNHTAAFLAMGSLMGCGCVAWSLWRKKPLMALIGLASVGVSFAALLTSQSRGGLAVFAIGVLFFVGLVLAKLRDRRAFGLAVTACFTITALGLAFGTTALSRFVSEHGHSSTMQRVQIWKDTLEMWKEAPVLGHGAGAFTSLYPLYQTVPVDELVVLHPESSWLQWLAEFGLLPVAVLLIAAGLSFVPRLRQAFEQRSGFFLFAGSLTAGVALLVHSAIDVPAHRWGTAGFGLAALALAFPATAGCLRAQRYVALVPLGIAAFWMLPLLSDGPAWSPLTADRLIARSATSGQVSVADLEESLRWFPLNAKLHQMIGTRQLITEGSANPDWARHFSIAARLRPASVAIPAVQARVCGQFAPQYAVSYWQKAIERAGIRRFEVFGNALQETASIQGSAAVWDSYTDTHPELLLTYAVHLPEAEARQAFNAWWQRRASGTDLHAGEIETFYRLAPRWLSAGQFEDWMMAHPERQMEDYETWAKLLHGWGKDAAAWDLLRVHFPEPQFPRERSLIARAQLEKTWTVAPQNVVNAQALAQARYADGDAAGAEEVILSSARREGAPVWFRHRGAYLLAARGDFAAAAALLLGTGSN